MTRTKEAGRPMERKALTPLAKDAYSYGAEQGFRLGYLAAGEVVASALGERHWCILTGSGTSSGGALTRWRRGTWPKR